MRKKGVLSYSLYIEETAPPPEFIKDAILVTAATLTIIKNLYDFYKIIKSRNSKSKVYVTVKGKRFDLEAYNIDELKTKMTELEEEDNTQK